MSDRNYCVYCHTSPSGKKYIGITSQTPARRWCGGRAYVKSPHFNRAIMKYGWENFEHEILCDGLCKEDACALEIKFIAEYQSNDPRYGYNLSAGGESGFSGCSWTEERREFARRSMRGNNYAVGFKPSEETRKRMREAQLRRKRVPLTEKQRTVCIANLPPTQSGGDNPAAKPVRCVELNIVYSCGKEAAEALHLQRAHISSVCHGKRATTGGYHFEFVEVLE